MNSAFAEQYQIDYSDCATVLCPAIYCNDTQYSTTCNAEGMCEVVKKDGEQPFLCDDGSNPVNCFVDPCTVAPKCEAHPEATCRADYCGMETYLQRSSCSLKSLRWL